LSVATRVYVRLLRKLPKPINVKIKDNVGTIEIDYQMQYYDVLTDARWRTAADIKIVMSAAYLSEK